ncbi:MAG: response regulator [Imperialibacter sp.]|uniref:response regulator n=1 Tax=Imperialibacter sp. TaxID=2038411 RepID=UPI003A838E6F
MNPINILLVEDNQGDVVLTREALDEGRIKNKIFVVKDGQEAVNYLSKEEPYSNAVYPDLILLDINLPKIDGKGVLAFIKSNKQLKKIPVVMLTTSSAENDIIDAYEAHANCYITKPTDVLKFFEVVHAIESFWLSIVKLPTRV